MNIQQLNTKVLDTMLEMLKPNNTLTTLELKLELKNRGISLTQVTVSQFMSVKADEGLLSYTDNGTYRTYSLIKKQPIKTQSTNMDYPKTELVNKTTLIETLKNNKGKRLTIVFTTKDKEIRKYNGMFTGHVSNLGWYQFRLRSDNEGNKVYKQFDAKNLLEVRVNKVIYKLKDETTTNKTVATYRHNLTIRKGSYSLEDLVLEKSFNLNGKEVIESTKVLELLKLVRVETLHEVANKSIEIFKNKGEGNIKRAILKLSDKKIEI